MEVKNRKRTLAGLFVCIALLLALAGCGEAETGETETASKTAPATLIFMGDPQSDPEDIYNYDDWGALLKAALTDAGSADAILLGGDLINEETDEQEREAFLDAVGDASLRSPIRCVSGNHTEDNERWSQEFQLPSNGPEGYESLFYSFDTGCIHVLMMDSQSMGSQDEDTQKMLSDWVASDLKNAEQPWKLAVMHHPMYPISPRGRDQDRAETMQKIYLPVLEDGGVDLILCGHQHVYGRTVPMKGKEPASAMRTGIVEVMGVSGGKLYSAEDADFIACLYHEGPVYTILSGNEASLTGKTVNRAGETIDSFELER